ncbi:hypothetical protein Tsubulata_004568 [Turnera subulata]|uniref:Uncharacterized protein n=1 Tax=Turnera subulata TaxID=218843 RepID=A0A9Q0FXI0_9ROSI|nr:hypothetical protein Tsubulata_004568 [Turnera subulata]
MYTHTNHTVKKKKCLSRSLCSFFSIHYQFLFVLLYSNHSLHNSCRVLPLFWWSKGLVLAGKLGEDKDPHPLKNFYPL